MKRSRRWIYHVCFLANLFLIALALHWWGAIEVRTDWGEVLTLTGVGAVWLIVATALFSWCGISYHHDLVDRSNSAALVALCGAVIALGLIYAGGSLGEGPSYANNFFSAGLGTAGWFGLWLLLELGGKVSVSVAEEHDPASGWRLAGFLLATALIIGRAIAGNWHSAAATVHDLGEDGWPALILTAGAVVMERSVRPSRSCPFPPVWICGLLPALSYLALAAAWLWHLGAWEGMPP